MDVSIIIVNYHSAQMVKDCVNSILEKTKGPSFEIIIVDNDSTAAEIDEIKSQFGKSVQLIPSVENLGFGKANNLGARYAKGKYLFLLNPDTILMNNAVWILFDYMEAHPQTGVAGGNLYMSDLSPGPSCCMHFDTLEDEKRGSSWGHLLISKIRQKVNVAHATGVQDSFNSSGRAKSVSYIFGADMMIRRDLFEREHGFDPDFFMYAEEQELSWRIKKEGYDIVSVPDAKIIHLDGATLNTGIGFSERQFRMRMNGKLIYYHKCFGKDGMETFYFYRRRQYKRLVQIAKWRKKDPKEVQAFIMIKCLDDEYQKYKEKIEAKGQGTDK